MTAKERLEEIGLEDALTLEEVFDPALIGTSDDDRAIYDFDKMIDAYCKKYGCEPDEAADYISNGIERWLPYMSGKTPIIMTALLPDE